MPEVDLGAQLFHETAIFQDHQVRMKNGGIVLRQPLGHPLLQKQGLNPGFFEGQVEFLQLFFHIDRALLKGVGKSQVVIQDVGRAGSQAGVGDGAAQGAASWLPSRAFLVFVEQSLPGFFQFPGKNAFFFLVFADRFQQAGVDDDGRSLKGDGRQGADVFGAELARFLGLDGENPDRGLAVEQGEAEKRMEALFAGFLEIAVTGMFFRLLDCHHRAFFRRQAGETFADFHGDLADRLAGQALAGAKTQGLLIVFNQVDGADFGTHAFGNQGDDVFQGFIEVVRLVDQGADILEDGDAQSTDSFAHRGQLFTVKNEKL